MTMKRLFLLLTAALLSQCSPAMAQSPISPPITPLVSAAAEAKHLFKATPGLVYGAYATNLTTTAGFLVIINATAIPVDGAITPLACIPLPASGVASINYIPGPAAQYLTGIVVAATSASTCFTLTTNVITAFLAVTIQ